MEERWLTEEIAAGRTNLSGIHAAAAEVRRVVFTDGVRREVERTPEQLPNSDQGIPRTTGDPLWMLDALREADATRAPSRALFGADLVAWLPPTRPARWSSLRARRRKPRQLLVWIDEAGRATRIALGEGFGRAAGPLWWIVEFSRHAFPHRTKSDYDDLGPLVSAMRS